MKIISTSRIAQGDELPIEVVNYSVHGRDNAVDVVRAFVAVADICGDFEVYGNGAIGPQDRELRNIVESLRLHPAYEPAFADIFLYAQVLYQHRMFGPAAPLFEAALTKLPIDANEKNMRRVLTDQAGIAYGASGNINKARAVFTTAIENDPDYPLYYYNLACADAEENRLVDAKTHLEQAFARKADVIPGESMPDPVKDDSFLPHRNDKEFWRFVESLH